MKHIIILIILLAVTIGGYFWWDKKSDTSSAGTDTSSGNAVDIASNAVPLQIGALTKKYKNDQYRFSFMHPESFNVASLGEIDGLTTVTVQDNKARGFQISIQKIDEDIQALTVERIRQDLPDIMIESPQDVILGDHGKGVAFISDDPSFDGRSREVWFVFDKHLYQIRTYEKYDSLLKEILSTWTFGDN